MTTAFRTAALLLIVAATACAPEPPPEPISPADLVDAARTPPIHALIGHRSELDLSSEQIAALDSIGLYLHRRNAPLERLLSELPRRSGSRERPRSRRQTRDRHGERRSTEQRSGQFSDPETARELMEEIAENNREARRGVAEVLTPEQKAEVCRVFRPAPERRTSPRAAERMPVWRWCLEFAEEEADTPRRGGRAPQNGL